MVETVIAAIVTALAAGASDGVKDVAKKGITEAYTSLEEGHLRGSRRNY